MPGFQLPPPPTPKWFRLTAHIAGYSLPLSLQTELCQKEKNTAVKDSTIRVHLFLRATHCNGKLRGLQGSILINWFKLYKYKSIRRHSFQAVVLFDVKSLAAFTSLHLLMAKNMPTNSFYNSSATKQYHVSPAQAASSPPTQIKTTQVSSF